MPDTPDPCMVRIVDYSKRPKEVLERAQQWLSACADQHGGFQRIATVFDIDETLLFSNKDDTRITHHPLGFALYSYCRDHDIDIHLVTARVGDRNSRKFVRDQLHALGYDGYKSLYMVNAEHHGDATAAAFKGKCRKSIANDEQKPIALNVGDQLTDVFADFEEISEEVARMFGPGTYYFVDVTDDCSLMTLKFAEAKDTYS